MQFYHNDLLGYEGKCTRCQKAERAYYYFADSKHRRQMLDGVFMEIRANCPVCVTSRIFSSPSTMKFYRKLLASEVEADLKTLQFGMQIDFDQAEQQAKTEQRMDTMIDNDQKRVQEYIDWKAKK